MCVFRRGKWRIATTIELEENGANINQSSGRELQHSLDSFRCNQDQPIFTDKIVLVSVCMLGTKKR